MSSFAAWFLGGRQHHIAIGAFVALIASALLASVAEAAPPDPPALTGTNPHSPSAYWQEFASRPYVTGEAENEEVVISKLGGTVGLGSVAMGVGEPEAQVAIYADHAACEAKDEAAAVGEGTLGELEEPGIQVEEGVVEPGDDFETTFYATLTDPISEETSKCSSGLAYRQVATPPPAPEFTATAPASPANDNNPRLIGVLADPQATVSIYPSATCPSGGFPSGGSLATGSAAQFGGEGIQVTVPDNSTTSFSAVATLAGFSSVCSSAPISYTEETPGAPGGGGGIEESGGGGGGKEGGEGSQSTDGSGGPSQPSAPDPPGSPPAPNLSTLPEGTANDNVPRVTGKAPEAVSVQVYGSAGCKGPVIVQGSAAQLSAGLPVEVADNTTSAFYGVSVDGGGDRSPCSSEPARYIEDSTPPQTRITAGPGVKTRRSKVFFRFADVNEDLSARFICKLDRRRWGNCSSPLRLAHLGHRSHLLRVKAIDAAGNRERVGTKRSFRVVSR